VMKTKKKKILLVAALVLMVMTLLAIAGCQPKASPNTGAGGNGESSNNSNGDQTGGNNGMVLPDWTINSDCTACHKTEVASATNSDCAYSVHAKEPNVNCVTCHPDTGGVLTTAHKDYGSAADPTRLKASNIPNETCLASGCHTLDDIIAATANSQVLKDANDLVVNPHDLASNADHDKNWICSTCHKQHQPNSVESTSYAFCTGCHHDDVWECNTCHPN